MGTSTHSFLLEIFLFSVIYFIDLLVFLWYYVVVFRGRDEADRHFVTHLSARWYSCKCTCRGADIVVSAGPLVRSAGYPI